MTDPLPQEAAPLSEADIRAALARAEACKPRRIIDTPHTTCDQIPLPERYLESQCDAEPLARECLRLRALLGEAAGALGPFLSEHARFTHELAEGGENCQVYCAGCECEEAQENAAAVAARVRGHLGERKPQTLGDMEDKTYG